MTGAAGQKQSYHSLTRTDLSGVRDTRGTRRLACYEFESEMGRLIVSDVTECLIAAMPGRTVFSRLGQMFYHAVCARLEEN